MEELESKITGPVLYLDFDTTLEELAYQIHHLQNQIDNLSSDQLPYAYLDLIHLRHDLLHYFCHKAMGIPWSPERELKEVLPLVLPEEYGRKTPDTVIWKQQENKIYMIDYSVSVDIHHSSEIKEKKYKPICDLIKETYGIDCCFIHINVRSDFTNLLKKVSQLGCLIKHELDDTRLSTLCTEIDNLKVYISKRVQPDVLDRIKTMRFERIEEKQEAHQTFGGVYDDINVDLEGMLKYNSGFNHVEQLEAAIGKYDKDKIENTLLEVSRNRDHPLYKKYADKILNDDQFDNAYNTIMDINKTAPKITPHPSHHMMVPHPDDTHYGESDKLEDYKEIRQFFKEYSDFYVKVKKQYESNKLGFLFSIAQTLSNCDSGENAEIYRKIFEGEESDVTEFIMKHKQMKKDRGFIGIYNGRIKTLDGATQSKFKKSMVMRSCLEPPDVRINNRILQQYNVPCKKHDKEALLKHYYHCLDVQEEYRNVHNLTDYLRKMGVLKGDEDSNSSWIIGKKKIKMPKGKQPAMVQCAFTKFGIKVPVEEKDRKPRQNRGTIPIGESELVNKIINEFKARKNIPQLNQEYDFLTALPSPYDSYAATIMKKDMLETYKPYLDEIMSTNAYRYSKLISMAYNQLFHVNEYISDNDTITFINMGLKNFCCVVLITKENKGGNPFMSIIRTSKPELYNNFWGQIYKYKIPDTNEWYVLTNARRLDTNKLTFLRDVHTSVLASSMNSAMSSPSALKYISTDYLAEVYTLRVLIGYSISQKVGELLVDTRYAYMSSLSQYTDLGKLLVDKFGYQFQTVIESWIIYRLITRLRLIHESSTQNGISNFRVTVDGSIRETHSLGGNINLPGLWTDRNLRDITEVLDEAFLYVHTIKEPASIFSEQIKAMNTIIKYQKIYDDSPVNVRTGCLTTTEDVLDYLAMDTQVGSCGPMIYHSTQYTLEKENPHYRKYTHEINDESLGEIMSTKAVIADEKREVVSDAKMNKREIKKMIRRHEDVHGKMNQEELGRFIYYRLVAQSKYYKPSKIRQKVWETIIDYMEDNPTKSKVVDLANDFLKNPIVTADICIKSQYGSKREFYVINIHAKAMARITETFFKKISENSPNEAISIPGDKKVLEMQYMLDRAHTVHKGADHNIIYTNGDCTKWSAAETMQAFLAMVLAFKGKISEGLMQILIATFNSWSNKRIQVPMELYNKIVPSEEYGTNYLSGLKNKNETTILSTQNFLQGMFNYSSSFKAVCCTNYTYYLWRKKYPETDLKIEHLEHSDDYVVVVLYKDIRDFEDFRVFHKMMMRLHGYNDSERKTCSQPFIMEFVSQMSYNGVMLYPQIKKTKEVNLSLPCTGYVKDMEAALSRVGECSRVGCNLSFLYFFQRLHCYHVANAYSVLPKQHNSMGRDLEQMLSTPIELFGIPDPLPIFSSYCKGNINNYRLYNYGNPDLKKTLRYLYKQAKRVAREEGVQCESEDDRYNLATPRFMYDMFNRSLQKIKKAIGVTPEDVKEFWSKHPVYKILKPKSPEDLLRWARCMFYNRTFMEAYSTGNRATMSMRIPKYVKDKIITDVVVIENHMDKKYELEETLDTIISYTQRMVDGIKKDNSGWTEDDEKHLSRILTKCDPTVSNIYSIMESVTITVSDMRKLQTVQIASLSPLKHTTIEIVNDPATVLQFIISPDDYVKDKRRHKSRESIEKDKLQILHKYGDEIKQCNENTMALLSVYNDLMICKPKRPVVYTYDRKNKTVQDFLLSSLRCNLRPGLMCRVTMTNIAQIIDPTDLSVLFEKGQRLVKDYHRQSLDNICLWHVFLTQTMGMSKENSIRTLNKFNFMTPSGKKKKFREVLSQIDTKHMDLNKYEPHERKICAYLNAYYRNDTRVLIDLVNSKYTFCYNYIRTARKQGGSYEGETIVSYTHFNTTMHAYHNTLYGPPVMVCNSYHEFMSPALYNIALRLTNCITESKYEKDPQKDRRTCMPWSSFQILLKNLGIENISHVVVKDPIKGTSLSHVYYTEDNMMVYPIVLTKTPLIREQGKHFSERLTYPTLDNESLRVTLGKSRLYILPYWKCHQYDNMVADQVSFEGIPLESLTKENRLELYLTNSYNPANFNKQLKFNIKEVVELMMRDIKKRKLYGFKFSTVVTNSNTLTGILDAPGNEAVFKKFISTIVKQPLPNVTPTAPDPNLDQDDSSVQLEVDEESDKIIIESLPDDMTKPPPVKIDSPEIKTNVGSFNPLEMDVDVEWYENSGLSLDSVQAGASDVPMNVDISDPTPDSPLFGGTDFSWYDAGMETEYDAGTGFGAGVDLLNLHNMGNDDFETDHVELGEDEYEPVPADVHIKTADAPDMTFEGFKEPTEEPMDMKRMLDDGKIELYPGMNTYDDIEENIATGGLYHIREYHDHDIKYRNIFGDQVDDNFIIEPYRRTRRSLKKDEKKEEKRKRLENLSELGTNYMVLRLRTLPHILLHYYYRSKMIPMDKDIMTFYNLTTNLQEMVNLYNKITSGKVQHNEGYWKSLAYVLLGIEKLLCRTYITDMVDRKQMVGFGYDDQNKIELGMWIDTKGKYTKEQIIKVHREGKILAYEGTYILAKTDLAKYQQTITGGLKNGILTQQLLMVTPSIDMKILDLKIKSYDDDNGIDTESIFGF